MENKVHYLETGSIDPYYNLAFEEYILTNRTDGDYLMLWQNDNTVVIGANQNTEEEINKAFIDEHHINVVRRATGGGAVYHDLGNLNYSFITDVDEAARLSLDRFTEPVVSALRGLGLDAHASGRNDILIGEHKVSGTAQRILGKRILHHGTLLFDSDPSLIAGALKVDPGKFKAKSSKSVRSRVGNIRELLGTESDMTITEFWDYLKEELSGSGFLQEELPPEAITQIEELRRTKYSTWEWNYGKSPAYDMVNSDRFDGGGLEVRLSVRKGVITDIAFYGDYMSRTSSEELIEMLKGCAYREADVASCLDMIDISDLFGSITGDEVLQVIFNR